MWGLKISTPVVLPSATRPSANRIAAERLQNLDITCSKFWLYICMDGCGGRQASPWSVVIHNILLWSMSKALTRLEGRRCSVEKALFSRAVIYHPTLSRVGITYVYNQTAKIAIISKISQRNITYLPSLIRAPDSKHPMNPMMIINAIILILDIDFI